jgi:uncharacterized membrane protein YdjX (TVP38/TMEM64 family)
MALPWKRIALAAAILAALAALWRFTPLADLLERERIAGWAQAVRRTPWAPIAIVLAYTPAAFLMFPRPLITLLAVIAFGRWLGFAYSMVGILLSALAAYWSGQLLSMATVRRYAGRHLEPVTKALDRHGVAAVFLMRVLPTAPHVVCSALAGALRVKLWQFAVGTSLGMLPGVLAATVFGGELAAALEDPGKMSWWIAGGVVVLAVLSAVAVRIWLRRKR